MVSLAILTSACSPAKVSGGGAGKAVESPGRQVAEPSPSGWRPAAGVRTAARRAAIAELSRRLPSADQRQIEGVAIQNTHPDGGAGLTVVIAYRDTRACARSRCRAIVTTDSTGRLAEAMRFTREAP